MAAAEAVLDEMLAHKQELFAHLYQIADDLVDGLREIMVRFRVPHVVQNVGPLISLFLTKTDVEALGGYRDVHRHCDMEKYIKLQHYMQRTGVFFHPNQFEPMFLSAAHSREDIDIVLERVEDGVQACLVR